MAETVNRTRQETMDWIGGYDWADSFIYTLTFPSNIAINHVRMLKNLRYFWNRVDKALYGNLSIKEQAYRCLRINMREPGFSKCNHHVHGLVQLPKNPKLSIDMPDIEAMFDVMEDAWENGMDFNKGRSPSAYHMADSKAYGYTEDDWISYITKTITDKDTDALCMDSSWFFDGQKPLAA